MDNVLGGVCVSYVINNMWGDSTTFVGPGLTYKNNIMCKKCIFTRDILSYEEKIQVKALDIKSEKIKKLKNKYQIVEHLEKINY